MEFNGESFIHSTLEDGYDFEITSKTGTIHHFKIFTFAVPTGLVSEAMEVVSGTQQEPYIFSILTGFDANIEASELLLKKKIKRGINLEHLVIEDDMPSINRNRELRGRIEWNDDLSDTEFEKVLIIDGRRITIERLGKMLESWEGYQFKFKIYEPTDEVE